MSQINESYCDIAVNLNYNENRYEEHQERNTVYTVPINHLENPPIEDYCEYATTSRISHRSEYLFVMIGYIVGIGGIIKLPYLVYKYSAAFFIPYAIFYFILGLPLFLLEIYIGQLTSRGCIECWKFSPLLKALGIGMVALTVGTMLTYNMYIVWALRYLIFTFRWGLPWSPDTMKTQDPNFSTQRFLEYEGFKSINSTGTNQIGLPVWEIVLLSLTIWVLLLLSVIYGFRYRVKVVYFTVIIPYVSIFILIIHSISLEGSSNGLKKFMRVDNLNNMEMWADAAIQIILVLSIAEGGLICFSSFCDITENLVVNTLIISSVDFFTSVLASIFSSAYFGYLELKNFDFRILKETTNLGVGFIAIPQALSTLPNSNFFAFVYYLLLVLIGFDTVLGFIRIINLAIVEMFKVTYNNEDFVMIGICVVGFITSIPLSTPGGLYLFHIFDTFSNSWTKLSTALLVTIILLILYNGREISKDIAFMLSKHRITLKIWHKIKWYFLILWYGPIQVLLLIFMIYKMYKLGSDPFTFYVNSQVYNYTNTELAGGWFVGACVPISSIITILVYLIKSNGSFVQRLRLLICNKKDDCNQKLLYPILQKDQKELQTFKASTIH